MGISQSVVIRQVAALEERLSIRLFERSRSGVDLTAPGQTFLAAVVTGLGAIQGETRDASEISNGNQVVIACSHETSHLLMHRRYEALEEALGEDVQIRLLTYQHYSEDRLIQQDADLVLTWNWANVIEAAAPEDLAVVFREELQLICSPGYAAVHAATLNGPVAGWDALTFLDLKRDNLGWTSWSDWFGAAGGSAAPGRYELFDSYIQLLEATVAGQGIAQGWRYYIDRYVDSGAVIMLADGFVDFGNTFHALLTPKGRKNQGARKCLSFFREWQLQSADPR